MYKWLFILSSIVLLASCQWGGKDDAARVNVKIYRYDRLQFESAMLNSVSAQQKMNIESPRATKLLIEDVLSIGRVNDADIFSKLNLYFADSTLSQLMFDCEEHFTDMRPIERELSKGFTYLKKQLPNLVVPRVYAQISALNQSIVVDNDLLGISLDKYMGREYPLYQKYYYSHQIRTMAPDRIAIDCIKFYLISSYPFRWNEDHRTLFDVMMYRGKIGWIVRNALGLKEDDGRLMGYSHTELATARKRQTEVWSLLKDKRMLEKTDPMLIRSLTQPAPAAVVQGISLPNNYGVWLGVKIIDQYMKQYPQTTVEELLNKVSFNEFIEQIRL